MEKKPFISIITPVYNGESYIDDAVKSVIAQTFTDWELILVDDGSRDKSLSKCLDWSGKDSRIKTISLACNGGAGNARNMGMDLACGRYITFMDIDDVIEKDLYERVTQDVISDESIDMVVWGVTEDYVDETGAISNTNVLKLKDKLCDNVELVRKSVIFLEEKTLFGYQWNHLYKKDIIKDNDIKFENVVLYEDYFFNLSVIEHIKKMKISSFAGYHYRKRQGENVTNRFIPEYFVLSRRRIKSMVDMYKSWKLYSPVVKKVCGERYLRYILSGLMRNNMPEAEMSHEDKKRFVDSMYRDELYKMIGCNCPVDSKVLATLQTAINKKSTVAILTFGKMAYLGKVKMPGFFSKKVLM